MSSPNTGSPKGYFCRYLTLVSISGTYQEIFFIKIINESKIPCKVFWVALRRHTRAVFFVHFKEVTFMSFVDSLPSDADVEKQLLSALMIRGGEIIPAVRAVVSVEDFYRPEHKILFNIIVSLFEQGIPPNLLSVFDEIHKTGNDEKISFTYLRSIVEGSFTNAYAIPHAKIVKEKSDFRQLIQSAEELAHNATLGLQSPGDIIAKHQRLLNDILSSASPSDITYFNKYLVGALHFDIDGVKYYSNRSTGFKNIDSQQLFTPGLYLLGATPAAGKTTFCQQLLSQLADKGETAIYCSYEMSRLELFSKSLARELFKRNPNTALTAAQIRRGATSAELSRVIFDLADTPVKFGVLELRDETIDDLLNLLKPLCTDKSKAPVVCLDYLQIVPNSRESARLGIDDSVRKLKNFQRDTNTTFIVISSFNRTNYAQTVSFESFKESGNIEYTADVVWAMQLNIMNKLKGGDIISESRQKIDTAKKRQPRQIHLKCLKNRQGNNYDCFFNYYSAHDYFEPCESFSDEIALPPKNGYDGI